MGSRQKGGKALHRLFLPCAKLRGRSHVIVLGDAIVRLHVLRHVVDAGLFAHMAHSPDPTPIKESICSSDNCRELLQSPRSGTTSRRASDRPLERPTTVANEPDVARNGEH